MWNQENLRRLFVVLVARRSDRRIRNIVIFANKVVVVVLRWRLQQVVAVPMGQNAMLPID